MLLSDYSLIIVEKLFKLLNIVVDVAFKLLIYRIELVDNEFKLMVVPYTHRSGLLITIEL